MAFPDSPLPIKHELEINGVWTDITTRTRGSDNVVINRGLRGEAASLSSSTCSFKLDNTDYYFSNKSPYSVNYHKLGRNPRQRVSLTETSSYLALDDGSSLTPVSGATELNQWQGSYIGGSAVLAAPTASSVAITGDIDVRIDIEPDLWRGGRPSILAARYITATNQRSWMLRMTRAGYLVWQHSTDGTSANTFYAVSTEPVPVLAGRAAVRVTMDVDNGTSGHAVTFYWSDTISGTWKAFSTLGGLSGTTSIFGGTSTSAALEIGNYNNSQTGRGLNISSTTSTFPSFGNGPFTGRVYAFQLYSGIAGTLKANIAFTGKTPGSTSFADAATPANTWTLTQQARIDNADYRFWGEISTFPQATDSSGVDVYSQAYSADILERLLANYNNKPLRSSLYRMMTQYNWFSWWAMEDDDSSAPARFSAEVGGRGYVSGAAFGVDDNFVAAQHVLVFSDDTGQARASARNITPTETRNLTGLETYLVTFNLGAIPPSATYLTFMQYWTTTGIRISLASNNSTYQVSLLDPTGAAIGSAAIGHGTGGTPDRWVIMRLNLSQPVADTPATISYDLSWYTLDAGNFFGNAGTFTTPGYQISPLSRWLSPGFTGKSTMQLGPVAAGDFTLDHTRFNFYKAFNAFSKESAGARFTRLCTEQGVPYWVLGTLQGETDGSIYTKYMGPQRPLPFIDLLKECTEVDGGYIFTPRNKFGLAIRLYNSVTNQKPVVLDYAQKMLSGEVKPIDDKSLIANDVTVTSLLGASSRAIKESGSLNVVNPDDTTDLDAVGTYDTAPTVNVWDDGDTDNEAWFRVFLGTWDESRYPSIGVNLARRVFILNPTLSAQIDKMDLFDPLEIDNLPKWLPQKPASLLTLGYVETLLNRQRTIVWSSRPYGPYSQVNNLTDGVDTGTSSKQRAAASGDSLYANITSSATSFDVAVSNTGAQWGTTAAKPGNFPLNVDIEGEKVTVGAIGATHYNDTVIDNFNRTVASGLGTASNGKIYAITGTAANFAVNGTKAAITPTTAGSDRIGVIDISASTQWSLVTEITSTDVTAAGQVLKHGLVGGYIDASNHYRAYIVYQTASNSVVIERVLGGTVTILATTVTGNGGGFFATTKLRFENINGQLRAKFWNSAGAEPTAWTVLVSDTRLTTGTKAGVFLRCDNNITSSPNGTFDNLATGTPVQTFSSVTRAVNGVSQAHIAGDDVQVSDLFYAAF